MKALKNFTFEDAKYISYDALVLLRLTNIQPCLFFYGNLMWTCGNGLDSFWIYIPNLMLLLLY